MRPIQIIIAQILFSQILLAQLPSGPHPRQQAAGAGPGAGIPAVATIPPRREAGGIQWPLRGPIGEEFHQGLDIDAPLGSPVTAAANGVVLRADSSEHRYGNQITLDHGRGITTHYAHLSRMSVSPGQHVQQGQVIGNVGMTGRTTGPHLHFEVRVHGQAVNPRRFLRQPSLKTTPQAAESRE
ncbi:MAG: hypothetical protein DMG26_03950 [Acidobacteria bacterium]|nr:MAG: hypothetical protein DMG26_03950 [Acidobacteriota bacterium]PYV22932.1 MAG: hypothetical protein DMG24_15380 [Acidobacteriota bacterium]